MLITSRRNPKIKYARRLQSSKRFRYQESAFVAESTRWLMECIKTGAEMLLVLHTEDWAADLFHRQLLDQVDGETLAITENLMAEVSELESPEGILIVQSMLNLPVPHNPWLLLVVDGISDPGNLGALMRTAAGADVAGILLAPGCVDVYNPKVVRGAMGAHLHIPTTHATWSEISALTADRSNYIAQMDGDVTYDKVDWTSPSTLIAGSEASGASDQAKELYSNRVYIPMNPTVESLNVTVAAGIILFEAARQHAAAPSS
jgi:TrmH family RNA methyltransferase